MADNTSPLGEKELTSTANTQDPTTLTAEETRAILTPFAFKIDQNLFGLPLAKPYKRGLALLIDLFCIAILSAAPGELLAIVIALTLYRLGKKQNTQSAEKVKGKKRRAILRGIGIFIIFTLLMDTLPTLFSYFDKVENKPEKKIENKAANTQEEGIAITSMKKAVEVTAINYAIKSFIKQSQCVNYQCWLTELQDFFDDNLLEEALSFNNKEIKTVFEIAAQKTNLSEQAQTKLSAQLYQTYLQDKVDLVQIIAAPQQSNEHKQQAKPHNNKQAKSNYSIIALLKGVINDLGLGFGWAAFYFTVFTALWNGQTLGKKILKIKVLQLDGTPLTLWDSFGRYGGYGAGIATGLLGFLQIFWDANRQAIHDKISATVVIDVIDK